MLSVQFLRKRERERERERHTHTHTHTHTQTESEEVGMLQNGCIDTSSDLPCSHPLAILTRGERETRRQRENCYLCLNPCDFSHCCVCVCDDARARVRGESWKRRKSAYNCTVVAFVTPLLISRSCCRCRLYF